MTSTPSLKYEAINHQTEADDQLRGNCGSARGKSICVWCNEPMGGQSCHGHAHKEPDR